MHHANCLPRYVSHGDLETLRPQAAQQRAVSSVRSSYLCEQGFTGENRGVVECTVPSVMNRDERIMSRGEGESGDSRAWGVTNG